MAWDARLSNQTVRNDYNASAMPKSEPLKCQQSTDTDTDHKIHMCVHLAAC